MKNIHTSQKNLHAPLAEEESGGAQGMILRVAKMLIMDVCRWFRIRINCTRKTDASATRKKV